ncbi:hypothetical protein QN372_00755 [Undibacterium sp. RTI2.1]|uniref:hypothetical protein n=1 Tax=unclassified Undibacterium TaxID=2630295 RepID=UPI002AB5715E|nr:MULTISPECIES: hypothetical protein [unclassified Undibacterium]MDY7537666.1 hypothetical protein [Undibacterium sp. 5I1]MEB0029268.1 hypothetical protein [Undibacterium sp. RTI2.1]MEB0115576.1 hypothetical protein [Undibacterium sp. RTI2.2]MEB0256403.1 hypothetical protein [Undibacterium sp. 5I1]
MTAEIKNRISTAPVSPWFEVHPALGITPIDHLYNRLDGAYPKRWRELFPDAQSLQNWRESWVEALEDERITMDEVKFGIKECRRVCIHPPSITEFLKACRRSLDPLSAYHEAIAGLAARERGEVGSWSSLALYWAAVSMSYDLKMLTHGQIKSRWESVLAYQSALGVWEPIPDIALRVEYVPAVASPEVVQAAREVQNSFTKEPGFDHLRWAKRIIERWKAGDQTVPLVSLESAQVVMGYKARPDMNQALRSSNESLH